MAIDNNAAAVYANGFRIGHNRNEFILEAYQGYEGDNRLITVSRFVITPNTAKELNRLLAESIQEYEQLNGPLINEGF